jgi:hypothetical protein
MLDHPLFFFWKKSAFHNSLSRWKIFDGVEYTTSITLINTTKTYHAFYTIEPIKKFPSVLFIIELVGSHIRHI